jgi:adenosine deaminase
MTGRVELHCHLDGSVRPDTIADLARAQDIAISQPIQAIAPPRCPDLMTYLTYLDVALSVLQTRDALVRAAHELVEDWAADGVVHGEARFAPQLHTRNGLTMAAVLDAVAQGLAAGRETTGISTALIVCCLRQQDPSVSLKVADLAASRTDVVAALDIAGDESRPATPHAPAFTLAREAGLRITAHAGEANGPDSIREVLDELGAERVGHGVRAAGDDALVERLVRDGVPLEMCPVSNVQTAAVSAPDQHPAKKLLDAGVRVTISTDARTVSNTTLTREFSVLESTLAWTPADTTLAQSHAATAAFAPKIVRSGDQTG